MSDEKQNEKTVPIGPQELEKIFKDAHEFSEFIKNLRSGTLDKYFERDRKRSGGTPGSLVAKDIRQPDLELQKINFIEKLKRIRPKMNSGGTPPIHPLETLDKEGQLRYWVNLLENIASNSYEDYLLDQARADLEKFLKSKGK